MFSKGKYVVQRTAFFRFDKLAQSFLTPITLCTQKPFSSGKKGRPKKASPFLNQTKIDEYTKTTKSNKDFEPTDWLELSLKEEIDIEPKEENAEAPRQKSQPKKASPFLSHSKIEEYNKTTKTHKEPESTEWLELKEGVELEDAREENIDTLHQTYKSKSEAVAWVKHESTKKIGIDTRSIQLGKIQTLSDIVDFINQPQNMILTIRERNILYDKLVKIFSRPGLKVDSSVVKPALTDFLAKFLVSLKTSENHKLYLAIFNMAVPKELFVYCEDFFRECLNEVLFNFPTLKIQELFPSLPSIQKFYYSINITEEYEKQAQRILEMAENSLDTMTIQNKMKMVNMMRASKVANNRILDFMLYYSEMNFQSMRYDDLLNVLLACMSAKRITPYELAYNLKNNFNKFYKELTPTTIIKTLGAFCKLRLMYTETMYDNIFRTIGTEQVIKGLSTMDCVLIINYYSKIYYRDPVLLESLMDKIKEGLSSLTGIHLRILVLSLAELNYNDYSVYGVLFKQFKNLAEVIQELRREENRSPFEEEYLRAVCEYISPGSSEAVSNPAESVTVESVAPSS